MWVLNFILKRKRYEQSMTINYCQHHECDLTAQRLILSVLLKTSQAKLQKAFFNEYEYSP